jgi:hypothetical protein
MSPHFALEAESFAFEPEDTLLITSVSPCSPSLAVIAITYTRRGSPPSLTIMFPRLLYRPPDPEDRE